MGNHPQQKTLAAISLLAIALVTPSAFAQGSFLKNVPKEAPTAATPTPPPGEQITPPQTSPSPSFFPPRSTNDSAPPTAADKDRPADPPAQLQPAPKNLVAPKTIVLRQRPDDKSDAIGNLIAGDGPEILGKLEGSDKRSWIAIRMVNDQISYVRETSLVTRADWDSRVQPIKGRFEGLTSTGNPIIDGKPRPLFGVSSFSESMLGDFTAWVASQGAHLDCQPENLKTYRCFTPKNIDIAEAAIRNGAAKTSRETNASYRNAEKLAREEKRGVWK